MSKNINVEGKFKEFLLDQKKLKKKLQEVDKKYELITENANDFIAILDKNLQYEYINEEFHRNHLGYLKDQLIGSKVYLLVHPDDVKHVADSYKIINERGEGKIELRIKHNHGYYIWVEVKARKFINVNGEPKFLLISRDISDRKIAEEKLKESEEKFRNIAEHSYLGILIFQNGRFKYVNKAMSRINGYASEEILMWSMRDLTKLIHPEDLPSVLNQFKKSFSDEDQSYLRNICRIITKNGDIKWNAIFANRITYEGDGALLVSVIDVTDNIEMEIKLKESEERYRLISENANDLIRVLNDRFEFEYINESVHKRLLGFTIDDFKGKTHLPFLHPEDRRHAIRSTLKNLKNGEGSYQARFKNKDGVYKWFEFAGRSFYDSKGEKKVLSIARDIHKRKIAELKLKESEEKYRNFVEQSQDGVVLVDEKGIIINWNKAQEMIFGLKREDVVGKYIWDIQFQTLPDTMKNSATFESLKTSMKQMLESGLTPWLNTLNELEIQDGMGNTIIVQQSRFTFKTNNGFMLGCITRDVTNVKEADRKIKESEIKYRKAYNRAKFYKDLFTHDMNNILSIITSSSELIPFYLTESQKSKDIQNLTTIVQNQVERGAKLIKNVTILSELEEEEINTHPTEADDLLQKSINFVKEMHNDGSINISVNCPENHIVLNANELLQDVFDNILINAIKYNENKNIEISINISKTKLDGTGFYKFEFVDNGIGVSDNRKDIIFKRGNRELKGTKGMGIGLSLVKKIIKSYGGTIMVEDKLKGDYSKGSNFILLIPDTNPP